MINHQTQRFASIAIITAALLLSACASPEKQADPSTSAERLYNTAKRALNQGDFLTRGGSDNK